MNASYDGIAAMARGWEGYQGFLEVRRKEYYLVISQYTTYHTELTGGAGLRESIERKAFWGS